MEEAYAKTGTPVVSNNSAHRWTPDVPMVIPEINPQHIEIIEHQRKDWVQLQALSLLSPIAPFKAMFLH